MKLLCPENFYLQKLPDKCALLRYIPIYEVELRPFLKIPNLQSRIVGVVETWGEQFTIL
jgi:hypothetical protein